MDTTYTVGAPYWSTPLDCGHVPTAPTSFHSNGLPLTTGAAHFQGRSVCYSCAADADRATVEAGETITAYVAGDGKTITTWAGEPLMKVTHNGTARTGFYGATIHYVRATAPNGREFYGKNGGNGQAINLKPRKS